MGKQKQGESHLIPRTLKFFYYCSITAAFCANILVVSQTTLLSVLGAGLALRGPDGSMMTATDGLYEERKTVFYSFGLGLVATVCSVLISVWLILSPEAALVCMSITIMTAFKIYSHYLRVSRRFDFNEDETVDFTDIFEGPANIRAVSSSSRGYHNKRRKERGGGSKKHVSSIREVRRTKHDYDEVDVESLSSEPESSLESQMHSDASISLNRRRRQNHHQYREQTYNSTPRTSGKQKKHVRNHGIDLDDEDDVRTGTSTTGIRINKNGSSSTSEHYQHHLMTV
uniref:Uncharacterized protein n=1 Tax=Ditylum brightwellii TaxID=49249 RepID=A0A6S8ZTH6_9STRA|mmetsp:Transcript_12320/g.17992  ORF Transcript_12320/g.17992 Transcript_12320/m.17992 type:complete len:285 (+) Transcript_12320:150-1004(+)